MPSGDTEDACGSHLRRVLLVEDHPIVRDAIRAVIELSGEFCVEAEASDGLQAVKLAEVTKLDMVLIDVSLPVMDGPSATAQILAGKPKLCILAISGRNDNAALSAMIRAGACGYITKGASPATLIHAMRTVCSGGRYLDPSIPAASVLDIDRTGSMIGGIHFAPRERQMLKLIAAGRSVKETATDMAISPETARNYRKALLRKTGASNGAGLAGFWLTHSKSFLEN